MIAAPEKRDELIELLIAGTKGMPGCLQYVISKDASDPSALWISEVWQDEASHKASFSLPNVQEAIAKGKPMIASFADRHVVEPIGGEGL